MSMETIPLTDRQIEIIRGIGCGPLIVTDGVRQLLRLDKNPKKVLSLLRRADGVAMHSDDSVKMPTQCAIHGIIRKLRNAMKKRGA